MLLVARIVTNSIVCSVSDKRRHAAGVVTSRQSQRAALTIMANASDGQTTKSTGLYCVADRC